MAAKAEKRWKVRLNRAVPWGGVVLSPKDTHEVTDSVLAEIGDGVTEKTEIVED